MLLMAALLSLGADRTTGVTGETQHTHAGGLRAETNLPDVTLVHKKLRSFSEIYRHGSLEQAKQAAGLRPSGRRRSQGRW